MILIDCIFRYSFLELNVCNEISPAEDQFGLFITVKILKCGPHEMMKIVFFSRIAIKFQSGLPRFTLERTVSFHNFFWKLIVGEA